jgi:putative two-component system response regulator
MTAANTGYILAVDDTPASLRLLTDLLNGAGYTVRSAISGALALRAASLEPPRLILLDINMPDMDGFEVCRLLKEEPQLRNIPVIFVSALSETQEILKGFGVGAVDYVTKPFHREELLARVHTHLELHQLREHLEEVVDERTRSLRESEVRLKNNLLETIAAIAAIVELRDPYTAGHQRRVEHLASAIAREMELPDHLIEGLRVAAVVHDLGKIYIPAEILSKPSHLTDPEYRLITKHPAAGYEILKGIDFPWPVAEAVHQHHERLDGTGYPLGLHGDEILLEARILAVADVIEAMASHRPYRPGLGINAALDEVSSKRATQFDPAVVDAALRLFREQGFQLDL